MGYNMLQKHQPTIMAKEKGTLEENQKCWAENVPAELAKLEKLVKGDAFTAEKTTVGELYLFAVLHQMACVEPSFLDGTPGLKKFYENTKALPGVKKVLDGESAMGALGPYFIKAE